MPFAELETVTSRTWVRPSKTPSSKTPSELVFPPGYLRGTSPATDNLFRQLKAVAPTDLPVLLTGETGVGKEGLARALHLSSKRRNAPFIALSSVAIPEDLLEAELFGVGAGVATGVSKRSGRFRRAHGGTLFLDEIGEMPLRLQPKLLRALQEKEVETLGEGPVSVDVRIVAATNADLTRHLENGRIRPDLYYRLAGLVLRVPPLRERREDIPALVEHFLHRACRETGRPVAGISRAALKRLAERRWPGNIRQLEHEVRRWVCLCPVNEPIRSATIAEASWSGRAPALTATSGNGRVFSPSELSDLHLERQEMRLVKEALCRTGGNQVQAAHLLGISRTALYRRIKRFGLR